jgi:leader peptidase (prepilin peptidase)/N-methyltransferase
MLLAAGVLGLLIGSFLNVVIARVPAGQSVVHPPSHCPVCERTLTWRENVPVLSWAIQRGRCRGCGTRISARYPIVELLGAATFVGIAARVGWEPALPAFLVAAAGMIALAGIDLDTHRLPDVVLLPTTVATVALLAVASTVGDTWDDFARAVLGGVIGFGALLVVHLAKPAGMGFGDVKLAFLCGVSLGWWGLADVLIGLYGGFVLGALVGLVLIATKRASFGRAIPFGPFLIAGTLLMVIAGGPLADEVRDIF